LGSVKKEMHSPTRKKADLRANIKYKLSSELVDKERLSLDFTVAEKNIPGDDRFVV